MKTINQLVVQSDMPNDNNVIWLCNNTAKYYNNGTWTTLVESNENIKEFQASINKLNNTVSDHTNQIKNNQSQITANKSAQDKKNEILDANMTKLNIRDDQITELVKGVTATGGASVATAVTYDNTSSQLISATVQGAVDELHGSKIDKKSILQELGNAEDKVMSQKAVTDNFTKEANRVNTELEKKANVEQVNNSFYDLENKIGDRFIVEGDVTNLPDEEDITSVNNKLKFKDREVDVANFQSKGYVILRKNLRLVNGVVKNILTQDMINNPNTIYEIRYEFDLDNAEVTIPENCVLKFEGGKLKNGLILGSKTGVTGNTKNIFSNLHITGLWNVPQINTNMFESLDEVNSIKEVFALSSGEIQNTIIINEGVYVVDTPNDYDKVVTLTSNTNVILNGTVKLLENNNAHYTIFELSEVKNVLIKGSGCIIGDVETHTGNVGEWGFGILISNSKNIKIDGISVSDCWGDNINIYGNSSADILIHNCSFTRGRRQGISVICGHLISINNCVFNACGYKYNDAAGNAIDLEPNSSTEEVSNVTITNCLIDKCRGGISSKNFVKDVIISNCRITDSSGRPAIDINKTDNLLFTNNIVINNGNEYGAGYFQLGKNIRVEHSYFEGDTAERTTAVPGQVTRQATCQAVGETSKVFFNDCVVINSGEGQAFVGIDNAIITNCKVKANLLTVYMSINNSVIKDSIIECPIKSKNKIDLINVIIRGNTLTNIDCNSASDVIIDNNEIDILELHSSNHISITKNIIKDLMYLPSTNDSAITNSSITDNMCARFFAQNLISCVVSKNICNVIDSNHAITSIKSIVNGNIFKSNKNNCITVSGNSNIYESNIIEYIGSDQIRVLFYSNATDSSINNNEFVTNSLVESVIYTSEKISISGNRIIGDVLDSTGIIYPSREGLFVSSVEHRNIGVSEERPTLLNKTNKRDMSVIGFRYFDTTINKPIWWTGTKWVDATGADV